MSEMEGFEKAFDDAIQYAKKHEDSLSLQRRITLLVV